MALVAGAGIDGQPLPAALLRQLLPPVRGPRITVPNARDDDERTPLIPTGTPASASSTGSTSSDPAATAANPAALPPVRGLRVASPNPSDESERTPLVVVPTVKPASASSTSASASASASSDSATNTTLPAATGAKQWRPFRHVRDVFGTWSKQRNGEPRAETDIEMAFPESASFPYPAASMVRANSAPPLWAYGSVADGRARRVDSNIGLNMAGTAFGQPVAISSVARVGAGTSSRSVVGAGSAFGSAVGAGAASGQADWMKIFKALLVSYVFFILPILLIFFPRYDKNQSHPVLKSLMDSSKIDPEKVAVLVFFMVLLTAGVLGVLLAHIARGPKVTTTVGAFTLWIIISILGFMDYILLKTIPGSLTNTLMFLSHFIITGTIICLFWFKYVWPSSCC